MSMTYRFPRTGPTTFRRGIACTVDGQDLPSIIEARTTCGFDQDLGMAEIVHPHPLPSWVLEGSRVVLSLGDPDSTEPGGGLVVSFTGYVETFSSGLYPGRHTAICKDVLLTASRARNPNEFSLSAMTDTEAVQFLLGQFYPSSMLDIGGLGLLLANTDDIQFLVTPDRTVLDMVREIDRIGQGWRTYATTDGRIVRRPISIIPTDTPARTFTEGVDLEDGQSDTDADDPYTDVLVASPYGSYTFDASNPDYIEPDLSWRANPYFQRLVMLAQVAESMTFLSMEAQAAWLFSQMSKKLIRGSFTTPIDTLFQGSETIAPTSEHLEVGQPVFIQNVQRAVSSTGKFSQTISWLSERTATNRGVTAPFTIVSGASPGPLVAPSAPTTVAPSASDVLASFVILAVVRELVIRGGVETFVYHISCMDTSTSRSGTIATRAWSTTGGGATITSGSGVYFSTTVTDLAVQITDDVTDTNGNAGTITKSPASAGVPVMTEKLYATDDTKWWAFNGVSWASHTPSNGQAPSAVAHGPFFAARGLVGTTSDDFATAAAESLPFGADTDSIGAVWKEPDVTTAFAAGNAAGKVALSNTGSSSWSIKTDPTGAPILRIIVSRYQPGEIHLISSTGYWVSDNYGSGWRLIRAGSFIDLNLAAHSWNVLVTAAGGLIDATTGTAFTFPSLSPAVAIVAATHHIRAKGVYAMDDQGRTFYTANYGSMALVQGSTIPAGTAQPRGIYRSGIAVGKIYCALGAGGLAEHTNGFEGDAGWELIRAGSTAWP